MKISKKLLLVSLILTLITFSCTKTTEDNPSIVDELFIKYTANGVDYKYTDPVTASSSNMTINGQIANSATDTDYSKISLWFPLGITTGTFDFTGDVFTDGDYKLKLISNPLNIDGWATSGSVTITSISSEFIEGSFTATVSEDSSTVSITSGEFKAYGLE